MNKFYFLFLFFMSCTENNSKTVGILIKATDRFENVIIRDSVTNLIVQRFKTLNDSIYGGFRDYEYYPSGSLHKEVLYDNKGVRILGYAKEYDSIGNLIMKTSYWFSEGFNQNIVNDYISFNITGGINHEKSSYVKLEPNIDTLNNAVNFSRNFSVLFGEDNVDSVFVYYNPKCTFKTDKLLLLRTTQVENVSLNIAKELIEKETEFYLVFKVFYRTKENKKMRRRVWKRFFIKS